MEGKKVKITLIVVGFVVLISFILFIRCVFGTYSVEEAVEIYRTLQGLDKKYKSMFEKREGYRHHIGWAEARGDHEEALRLARDLEALDDDIDAVEREIILWKKGGKGKKEHVL